MTREEAIDKVLDEIQEDFLKVNLPLMEKMTLFAKTQNAVRYVADLPTVEAIPLSVVEKIHDAIDDMDCEDLTFYDGVNKLGNAEYVCRDEVHEIIDKAVKECDT